MRQSRPKPRLLPRLIRRILKPQAWVPPTLATLLLSTTAVTQANTVTPDCPADRPYWMCFVAQRDALWTEKSVPGFAAPLLVDVDNDVDLDLLLGAGDGQLRFYENIGTPQQWMFVQREGADNPFNGVIFIDPNESREYADQHQSFNLEAGDLDADGDQDVLVVNRSGGITYFENISQHPLRYQVYDYADDSSHQPFREVMQQHPQKQHLTLSLGDLDVDGDLDLLIGLYDGRFEHYENIGDAFRPHFVLNTRAHALLAEEDVALDIDRASLLKGDGRDRNTMLHLSDLDVDGDLDVIVGMSTGETKNTLIFYENVRQSGEATFVRREGADHPLAVVDAGDSLFVTTGDLDADGDEDVLLGNAAGELIYYESVQALPVPHFKPQYDKDKLQRGHAILDHTRGFPVPVWADLDADGDLDGVIGSEEGILYYAENQGTPRQALFSVKENNETPWGEVSLGLSSIATEVEEYSSKMGKNVPRTVIDYYHGINTVPSLGDLDNDGDWDMLVGIGGFAHESRGTIAYFENIGTAQSPEFVQQPAASNPLSDIALEDNAAPALVDLDGDGDLDVLLGQAYGRVLLYENIGSATQAEFRSRADDVDNPLSHVRMSSGKYIGGTVPIPGDMDLDGDMDLWLSSGTGSMLYYENIGTAQSPEFVERTAEQHPLYAAEVSIDNVIPAIGDLDSDGDLDVFLAYADKDVALYDNAHPPLTPAVSALPVSGFYANSRLPAEGLMVHLQCQIPCETLFYSLNDAAPVAYTQPLSITEDSVLKFASFDAQGQLSPIYTERYVIDHAAPQIAFGFTSLQPYFPNILNKNVIVDQAGWKSLAAWFSGSVNEEQAAGVARLDLQIQGSHQFVYDDPQQPLSPLEHWMDVRYQPDPSFHERFWPGSDTWLLSLLELAVLNELQGAFTLRLRAVDYAGHSSSTAINVFVLPDTPTEMRVQTNKTHFKLGEPVIASGQMSHSSTLPLSLAQRPIELRLYEEKNNSITFVTQVLLPSAEDGTFQYEFNDLELPAGRYRLTLCMLYMLGMQEQYNSALQNNCSAEPLYFQVGSPAGYAVLLQADASIATANTLQRAYQQLKLQGFEDKNIVFFSHAAEHSAVAYDAVLQQQVLDHALLPLHIQPSNSAVTDVLQHWAAERMTAQCQPLFLVVVGDAQSGQWVLNAEQPDAEGVLTVEDLHAALSALEEALPTECREQANSARIILLGGHHSGTFQAALSQPGRIVMSSAAADEIEFKGFASQPSGSYFIDHLFYRLGHGFNLREAFLASTTMIQHLTRADSRQTLNPIYPGQALQHPLLNDNGDDRFTHLLQTAGDGLFASDVVLGAGNDRRHLLHESTTRLQQSTDAISLFLHESPQCDTPQGTVDHCLTLWLQAESDTASTQAQVYVRKPQQALTQTETGLTLPASAYPMSFDPATHRYVAHLENVFTQPGRYDVFYSLQNEPHLTDPEHASPLSHPPLAAVKHSVVYRMKPLCGIEPDADCNHPPPAVTALYPKQHAADIDKTTRFDWLPVTDPDGDSVSYALVIFDTAFEQIIYSVGGLQSSAVWVDSKTPILRDASTGQLWYNGLQTDWLTYQDKYPWGVAAIDEFGAFSEVNFEILDISDSLRLTEASYCQVQREPSYYHHHIPVPAFWLGEDIVIPSLSVFCEQADGHYTTVLRKQDSGVYHIDPDPDVTHLLGCPLYNSGCLNFDNRLILESFSDLQMDENGDIRLIPEEAL